jgi:hypothetical protein
MARLTTRQDLHTRLFRVRILIGVLAVAVMFAITAFFPNIPFIAFFVLWFFLLPSGGEPYDLHGALTAAMFIAICMGPEFHKYSLAFNVGFTAALLVVLVPMAFFIARVTIRGMNLDPAEPKQPTQ